MRITDSTAKQQLELGIDRFVELMPHKPYCTDDKGYLHIRTKKHALKKRYVQHNPPAMKHWLSFDIDHSNRLIWEDAGLPPPNMITMTPSTGRSHMLYAIEGVCTSDIARPKPLAYAAAIQAAYVLQLDADPGYSGLITKNPLHIEWSVDVLHNHVYTLGELADHVDLNPGRWTRKRAANEEQFGLGRNCSLFHRLRYWAYDWLAYYRDDKGCSYEQWMEIVRKQAESFNAFPEPLDLKEVGHTAKSVGKWVWTKYTGTGSGVKRGAMAETFKQSELELDLKTKQRLSARHTHQVRRNATEEKIIGAIGQLTASGKKVTKAAVGRIVGMSRQKVSQNYSHLFLG